MHIEALAETRNHGVTPALARAAVRGALREVVAVESPTLSVLGGLADVVAIKGIAGPSSPSQPTGEARFVGAQMVADAVRAAFADALPHLTHAPDVACLLLDLRGQRDDGTLYRARLGLPGGLGASVLGDGLTHGTSTFSPYRTHGEEDIERFRLVAERGLKASDVDVFVEFAHDIGLSTSKNIPGFIHPNKLLDNYPALRSWSEKWSKILGREITPGGFMPGTFGRSEYHRFSP